MPPEHSSALRGAGEQQEAVPDDGVRQRWRPVLQDHHQGEAEQPGDQADVCTDRLCRHTHGEFGYLSRHPARTTGLTLDYCNLPQKLHKINIRWLQSGNAVMRYGVGDVAVLVCSAQEMRVGRNNSWKSINPGII